jgi:hypothetical protein
VFIISDFYLRVTSIPEPRRGDAKVKVLLSIGGWTDSSGDKYSRLVNDGGSRRRFVDGVVAFLRRHNFGGLHLDWQYPKCWQSNCAKGPASDKPNFTKLIQVCYMHYVYLHDCNTSTVKPLIIMYHIVGIINIIHTNIITSLI